MTQRDEIELLASVCTSLCPEPGHALSPAFSLVPRRASNRRLIHGGRTHAASQCLVFAWPSAPPDHATTSTDQRTASDTIPLRYESLAGRYIDVLVVHASYESLV